MLTATLSSFLLIFLAEFGDKSQLVCMVLASRHRGLPVWAGAVLAFALLNALAVTVGAAIAQWLPEFWLSVGVAVLFALFGVSALRDAGQEDGTIEEKSRRNVFFTAFVMIFAAEFGDKTQLSVAALGAAQSLWAVYIGATLALAVTTCLGVLGGRWLTQRIAVQTLHKAGGVLFLLFAAWAAYNGIQAWQ